MLCGRENPSLLSVPGAAGSIEDPGRPAGGGKEKGRGKSKKGKGKGKVDDESHLTDNSKKEVPVEKRAKTEIRQQIPVGLV